MAEYLMLFRFTTKGAEKIKESPNRVKDAKKLFEAGGAKVKAFYAFLGRYDTAFIVEAPDDETIVKLSLKLSSLGNVHTETLRAFNEDQYGTIVKGIS
jgi:uncharacterized protein with GYD domain